MNIFPFHKSKKESDSSLKEHKRFIRSLFLSQSLSLKIIFYIGSLLVIAILLSFYLNNEAHEKELIDLAQLQAHRLSDTIKNTIRHSMIEHGSREELQALIEKIGYRDDIVKVFILDKGKVDVSSWREEVGMMGNKEGQGCNLCHFTDDDRPPLTVFIHRIFKDDEGRRFIELFNPINNEPVCYECHEKEKQVLGVLTIITSLSRMDKSFLAGKKVMIISTIIIFLLVSFEIFYFIYRFVHCPIQKLSSATKRVAQGDIDYHIDIHTTDEIGELANSFNIMTERLKRSWSEIETWNRELEKRVRDATALLRETNKELQETNKRLKIADQKKTEVLVTVAHDIRGPLAAIKTCVGVVLGGYISKEPQKQKEMLRRAEQRAEELLKFTNDLLDLSLAEESWQGQEDVNCSEILDSLMPELDSYALHRRISLTMEKQDNPLFLKGDKQLLSKVFNYISQNSIKYSHPKGSVSIKLYPKEGDLVFSSTDEGIGIPESEMPCIFEPTFRGELARKHDQSGTGVSMALVERIVHLHKGKLSIKSKVGQGTIVTVTFPLSPSVLNSKYSSD